MEKASLSPGDRIPLLGDKILARYGNRIIAISKTDYVKIFYLIKSNKIFIEREEDLSVRDYKELGEKWEPLKEIFELQN